MSELHVACSDDKRDLLGHALIKLNQSGPWKFVFHYYSDEEVIRFVLGRDFGILCPKSVLSLQRLEEAWQKRRGENEDQIFSREVLFGTTPIVFFMSPQVARRLDVFKRPFGWQSLADLANTDGAVLLRHAAFGNADGTAVAIAQQLAINSKEPQNKRPEAFLHDLRRIEGQIDEYGPDDQAVLDRAVVDGVWHTDIVIAQEYTILSASYAKGGAEGVIVYPHDGTLTIPNVTAIVSSWAREGADGAFQQLEQVLSSMTANELNAFGFHLNAEDTSSLASMHAFIAAQPSQVRQRIQWAPHAGTRTLVLPARRVVQTFKSVAAASKRAVDVCILFDSSQSMSEGEKLTDAISGVRALLRSLAGTGSRAEILVFNSDVSSLQGLTEISAIDVRFDRIVPTGQTALLDAVYRAYETLALLGEDDHMLAIIGFTDGQENASTISQADLMNYLTGMSKVRFYGIAYGADADLNLLSALALATRGLAVRGTAGEIQSVFERLSTYI